MEKETAKSRTAPKRYTREALLESRTFSRYQRDFLAALLPEESYTLEKAQSIVDGFFGPEKKGA